MIVKNIIKGEMNRYFLILLVVAMLTTFFDITAVSLDEYYSDMTVLQYLAHTLYLMFHMLTAPIYVIYMLVLVDKWYIGASNPVFKLFYYLPVVLAEIMLLFNLKFHFIFYIDSEGRYVRGNLMLLNYYIIAVYGIYAIFVIIKYRKHFGMSRFISLSVGLFCVIASVIIQFLFPKYLIEMFGEALGLLFILMMIRSPIEILDSQVGLLNLNTFMSDISLGMNVHRRKKVILISITNQHVLNGILGYDSVVKLAGEVGKIMEEETKHHKIYCNNYFLEDGKFAIVIREDLDDEITNRILVGVNSKLKNNIIINDMRINILANICMTVCPEDIDNAEILFKFSQDLQNITYTGNIYYASEVFSRDEYDMQKGMEAIIESALNERKFQVYYQPIYDTKARKFRSAEALIRLNDEKYGFIPPDVFIPVAEKSGAIHRIGAFVLEEVCKFIVSEEFRKTELEYIEVNLSVIECMQSALIAKVVPILEKYHVSPDKVNLEITETAVGDMQNTMLKNIDELHEYGISFSLDDYGTGYSNMQRIASLPLSLIKIDKTLAANVENENTRIVVENTIKMIKALNKKIVIEGVETKKLEEYYSELKCDYIQGYYFSKPLPKNDFVQFIENN